MNFDYPQVLADLRNLGDPEIRELEYSSLIYYSPMSERAPAVEVVLHRSGRVAQVFVDDFLSVELPLSGSGQDEGMRLIALSTNARSWTASRRRKRWYVAAGAGAIIPADLATNVVIDREWTGIPDSMWFTGSEYFVKRFH